MNTTTTTKLSLEEANKIVDEEFNKVGWTIHERPIVDNEGHLNDGNFNEPARLESEQALRAQCQEWIGVF